MQSGCHHDEAVRAAPQNESRELVARVVGRRDQQLAPGGPAEAIGDNRVAEADQPVSAASFQTASVRGAPSCR